MIPKIHGVKRAHVIEENLVKKALDRGRPLLIRNRGNIIDIDAVSADDIGFELHAWRQNRPPDKAVDGIAIPSTR